MKKYFVVLGLVLALTVVPLSAGAQSIGDLQALIASLQAQIAALTAQLTQLQGGGNSGGNASGSVSSSLNGNCVVITRPLYRGLSDSLSGGEVSKLQRFLKSQGAYDDEISGFYGSATEAGVRRWQASNGVVSSGDGASTGFGLVGSLTRERIRRISCGVNNPVPVPMPPPVPPISVEWQTFSKYGYQIQYPPNTSISDNDNGSFVFFTPPSNISKSRLIINKGTGVCKSQGTTRYNYQDTPVPVTIGNNDFVRYQSGLEHSGMESAAVAYSYCVSVNDTRYVLEMIIGFNRYPLETPKPTYSDLDNDQVLKQMIASFKITDSSITNKPPVITGLTAPSTLNVGQTGTWAVQAYDPEGGALNYSVNWGDQPEVNVPSAAGAYTYIYQSSSFTHSYSAAGTYKVTLTVSDNSGSGQSAVTTATVQVGSVATTPSITVISPADGEKLTAGQPYLFKWKSTGIPANTLLQIEGGPFVADNGQQWDGPILHDIINDGQESLTLPKEYARPSWPNGHVTLWISPQDYNSGYPSSSEVPVFIINDQSSYSLMSSLKVTVLNGGIQCIKAPCEFPLAGAQVALYDASKMLVGSQTVGSDGAANFSNLNPGTYTAYASASGYTKSNAYTVGLVSGQAGSVKIPIYPGPTVSLANDSQLAATLSALSSILNNLAGVVNR